MTQRFNSQIFKRFWAIAKPYWTGDEKKTALGLLAIIVVMLLAYTGLSVLLNTQRGELISALSAKSESRFWRTVAIFLGILVVYAPLLAGYTYLRDRLGLAWRRWLTDRFTNRYFSDRAFYRINQFSPDIDNPDQRIAEDVKSFTQESLTLLLVFTDSVLEIIAFSGVLWGISWKLVLFLVAYAGVGTVLTVGVFGQPLVRLNFEQLKKEANFRFSLVRIRENAEAIAFYQGEEPEAELVSDRFLAAFDNFKRLLLWELGLNGVTNFYEFIPFVLPAIVVAPTVFSGEVEVGKVSEAQGAFIRVFFSLNVIVARLQSLTAFGAGIDRLYDFSEVIEATLPAETELLESEPSEDDADVGVAEAHAQIEQVEGSTIRLQSVTLQTPNAQRTLIEDLSLELTGSESLLVMGPSGCGKSSLLRAIAGLWDTGSGTIQRPPLDDVLFLPQKPYMPLGNLDRQLRYPYDTPELDREAMQHALEQVNLPDLADRYGGWDSEQPWSDVLSLGEQQRLSLARVILHRPKYVLLDEATSALDPDNEARLYEQLKATGTTFLSIGHREALRSYHQNLLRLNADHTWQLTEI